MAPHSQNPLFYRKGGGRRECAGYYNTDNNGGLPNSGVHCVILAKSQNVRNDNQQYNRNLGTDHNHKREVARWEQLITMYHGR